MAVETSEYTEVTGARRPLFSHRPKVGTGAAAKQVAEDARNLVRAEIALAKAELMQSARAKGLGIGMLLGAAVFGWLALQGLLLTAGFALALVVPGWAAALIVTVILLVIAGGAALVGKKKLATPMTMDTTKHNVEEDVAWTKAHLRNR
jgi:uncharacterized membrane protein YqjE